MSADSLSAGSVSDNDHMPIRVFLVDDHEVVRRGIVELLESEADIEVVGVASALHGALETIHSADVDVAVVDVRLPDGNGIELCRTLKSSSRSVACVMFTAFADDEELVRAVDAGAYAFVLKQVTGVDLVRAIRCAAKGVASYDNDAVSAARTRLKGTGAYRLERLTAQERRVFDLIGEGRSNRSIAENLGLAEKTVKNYITSILLKLSMERRTEVAALAARLDERQRR